MTASTGSRAGTEPRLLTAPLVLMYHSVSPEREDPYEVTVSPHRFEQQMRWLRSRRLRGVSMAELVDAAAGGNARGLVGLTFDDGYRDFLTEAMPILDRFGFSATVFVLTGRFGGTNDWDRPGPEKALLSADEVCRVAASGFEIASHGVNHVALGAGSDAALLATEVRRSKADLQDLLGEQVRGFCYPYGSVDARAVGVVRDAGYDYACAIWRSAHMGRHALPRTYVHNGDSPWRMDAKRLVSAVTVGNRLALRHGGGKS
jgi:peptidoglycan/xylan/chitin deacetylase (PgdA/CDA1 family)